MSEVWVVYHDDYDLREIDSVWATREAAIAHVEEGAPTFLRFPSDDPDWVCWDSPEDPDWVNWFAQRFEVGGADG